EHALRGRHAGQRGVAPPVCAGWKRSSHGSADSAFRRPRARRHGDGRVRRPGGRASGHGRGVGVQPSRRADLPGSVLRQRHRDERLLRWRGPQDALHYRFRHGSCPDGPRSDCRPHALFALMKKLLIALLLMTAQAALAQPFPAKPVKIIVAFPPGGGTDIVARLLGERLSRTWSQPVVVENRAGASGTIGTELAAKSEADGYTLFMATMGNMTANQHLYRMSIDPLTAFAPITKVV